MSAPHKPAERPKAQAAIQKCISPDCGAEFGLREQIYVCRKCGGPLEIDCGLEAIANPQTLVNQWETRATTREDRDRSGVWRFREALPFDESAPIVTLFEGNTPLYDAPKCARYAGLGSLTLKHQGCNPTGSFKDTGMTTAVTQASILGARAVVCASTGNTAASLAAYAARANLRCVVLLPEGQVSPAKLAQSMDYGATIFEVAGNFDDCMRLTQDLADVSWIYIANSINPFRIEGQKTVAYELMMQLNWKVPDHVVVPGGNMGNSSALGKGFEEMKRMGLIARVPKLSIVQAEGAAPLAHLFSKMAGAPVEKFSASLEIETIAGPRTLATAIRIGAPVSWKKALRAVVQSGGNVISVSETELADAKATVGLEGIGCEPASAATVAGIKKLVAAGTIESSETVVAVLTGHVLKDPDYVSRYHRSTLTLDGGETIAGSFTNVPVRVAAAKDAIVKILQRD
ncbi:MAG TPA: threonine synthase [Candidatus Acidoferrales bacterium]